MEALSHLLSLFSWRKDAKMLKSKPEGHSAHKDIVNEDVFDVAALPEELFLYILSWVPAVDLVKNCSRVCRQWWEISRSPWLWKMKCKREGKYIPHIMGPPPADFVKFYFCCPYTRNLLSNDRALEGFKYWEKTNGEHLSVEDSPGGAKPIQNYMEINGPVKNWVTSYEMSSMTQVVSLIEEGCVVQLLDEVKPDIYVSAWCAARWDCGSKFVFKAQLLNDSKNILMKFKETKDLTPCRKDWYKIEHTFREYPAGVRYVKITMAGVDTQFWAGYFGSKFTLPCAKFVFHNQHT